jgi:serine/threonine protein kinase
VPFFYLVFEYVEHDLAGILDAKKSFAVPAVKCLLKQLLSALEHLHLHNIVHRDLKCSNLLVSANNGTYLGVPFCDFMCYYI